MLFGNENSGLNTDVSKPTAVERTKLWEEDCNEIFLAPDPSCRQRYFEIEVGPFGHFFDVAIDRDVKPVKSDVSWSSSLTVGTQTDPARRTSVIEVRISAPEIVRALAVGARLPVNLFRMEGKTKRRYLAWSPPRTPKPNFHVPEAFGNLICDP